MNNKLKVLLSSEDCCIDVPGKYIWNCYLWKEQMTDTQQYLKKRMKWKLKLEI